MPTLHIDAADLKKLLGGETIEHPVTRLRVELDKEAVAVGTAHQKALEQIAGIWPEPGSCAELVPEWIGPNDGRMRADKLWQALNTARAALGKPTYPRPEHWERV